MSEPRRFVSPRTLALIQEEEGFRAKPFLDTEGNLTVGSGFNLDDSRVRPMISQDVIEGRRELQQVENRRILEVLANRARQDAISFVGDEKTFTNMAPARQRTLINMAFQLGLTKLNQFSRLRAAILSGDTESAAAEILDSLAAQQTPARFQRNADRFRRGGE